MTAPPVVLAVFILVNIISHLYHRIYGLLRHRRPNRRPRQHTNHPFRRRPPRSPIAEPPRGEPMSTCVSGYHAYLWSFLPSSHQGDPHGPTDGYATPKFFLLPGVDWCITTVNSSLMRRRVPKALLSFFCPTKPPIVDLTNPCMASVQAADHAPHQIKFDTDSQKFLIDSGASAHIWNRRKDFISYRVLSPQERKNDQVLGVSGETAAPQGIGSIRLRIEDDLNDIHTIHLHEV